jgi:LPXTG-motif cell wall-anchored protein
MGSSGSGGQSAMIFVWVILVLMAAIGAGVYAAVRRRRARRP